MSQDDASGQPQQPRPSPAMAELAARLEAAAASRARQLGLDRLELRYQADRSETARAEHSAGHGGEPDTSEEQVRSAGISARAFIGGAIGHAACATPSVEHRGEEDVAREGDPFAPAIEAAIEAAVALARSRSSASSRASHVLDTDEDPARGHHETRCAEPLGVLDAPRIALAAEAAHALLQAAGVDGRTARAHLALMSSERIFASSNGARVTQRLRGAGGGLSLLVEAEGQREERSYPMGGEGLLGAGGWELVRALYLGDAIQSLADEARALVRAPLCPAATTSVILSPEQLCLQIHASVGLALEADRVLREGSSAAGSFVDERKLGRFRYGSTHVNLVADGTLPGGLGSFGWDDEGVAARRTPLVQRGQLVGLLTTRRTAARLGLPRSGGCLRAALFHDAPLLRMTNIVLEPEPSGPTLEELVADTPEGVLLGSNRSWTIDARLIDFEFGCEAAWELRGGRRTRLLRRPMYRGLTPRFWAGCDAVGRASEARVFGLTRYAKGEPTQLIGVSHGGPPARFHGVEVGAAR